MRPGPDCPKPAAHINLGIAYRHLNKLDDAIRSYEDAIRIDASPSAYNALCWAHFYKGAENYGHALAACRTALEQHKRRGGSDRKLASMLHDSMSWIHLATGNYTLANEEASAALKIEPVNASSLLAQGQALQRLARIEPAQKSLLQAVSVLPGRGTLTDHWARSSAQEVLIGLGRQGIAAPSVIEALRPAKAGFSLSCLGASEDCQQRIDRALADLARLEIADSTTDSGFELRICDLIELAEPAQAKLYEIEAKYQQERMKQQAFAFAPREIGDPLLGARLLQNEKLLSGFGTRLSDGLLLPTIAAESTGGTWMQSGRSWLGRLMRTGPAGVAGAVIGLAAAGGGSIALYQAYLDDWQTKDGDPISPELVVKLLPMSKIKVSVTGSSLCLPKSPLTLTFRKQGITAVSPLLRGVDRDIGIIERTWNSIRRN